MMSKEREQHPCLSEERLEIAHKLLGRETEKKYKIEKGLEKLCQSCRIRPFTKKLKTRDKLTLRLCDNCLKEYQAR